MTNNLDRKLYEFGDKAHEKLAEGIRKGIEVVASTLGIGASNVLIERKFQVPQVIDDGLTAINNLILDDELENLGVTSLVDAANKTSEHVGDGTSTCMVLVKAIYEAGRKLAGNELIPGLSPFQIKKQIFEARDKVLNELKKSSKKIKTVEEIRQVAYAAYSDDKIANTVAELIEKVGENGIVLVEDGWGRETETEFVTGMRFAAKLASNLFANTPEEDMKLEGLPILVTDFDFVNLNDIMAVVKELMGAGEQGLIIVANKYERMAIDQVVRSNMFAMQNRSPFRIWLARTPSFTPGEFEDLATYLGARYFEKEKGEKILEAQVNDLGRASVFRISKVGDGVALGGAGKKEDVKARIEELKIQRETQKVKMIKGRIEQRIGSLAAAIGIIKVASPSSGETEHIRLKTKNAVKSSQAAIEEGVVKGGGLCLKEIAEGLDDNILTEALKVPYKIIKENAGEELDIKGVMDATKVVRTAVEQACSQAWLLINAKTIIAIRTERDRIDAAEIIAKGRDGTK